MKDIPKASLKQFFDRIVKRAFSELFISDSVIIEYISDVLARFARTENLYRIRDSAGRRLDTVVEMLIELERGSHPEDPGYSLFRERDIQKHLGDYTLFMTGIFRENVIRRSILGYYIAEGRKSYKSVSEFDRVLYKPGAALFEELSAGFERFSGALDYMKKVYFRPEIHSGPYSKLMREFL